MLLFATVEIWALHAIAFATSFKKCLYDDDCLLGTACIFPPTKDGRLHKQSICVDCAGLMHMVGGPSHAGSTNATKVEGDLLNQWWLLALETLLDMNTHWDGHVFTAASTGDRWPSATSAPEFCENQLATPFIQAWSKEAQHYARDGTRDFSKCMHVQEALHTHGMLDFLVLLIAFVLVSFSILNERSQQLFTRHLRRMLLPPIEWRAPWKTKRTIAFKLLEVLLSAMLPSVCSCCSSAALPCRQSTCCSMAWPSPLSPSSTTSCQQSSSQRCAYRPAPSSRFPRVPPLERRERAPLGTAWFRLLLLTSHAHVHVHVPPTSSVLHHARRTDRRSTTSPSRRVTRPCTQPSIGNRSSARSFPARHSW